MNLFKRTWCEINLDCLQYNINLLQGIAKKELFAVVKANAYGHGDEYVSQTLQDSGIRRFAVSNFNEAANLRNFGISGEILILGYTPPEYADHMVKLNITQTVHTKDYANKLNDCVTTGKLNVHVKVDTGMGRIGFVQNEQTQSMDDILALREYHHLVPTGIFTHFAVADSFAQDDEAYTLSQMKQFDTLVDALASHGMTFPTCHIQNSAGIINYEDSHCSCARAGIAMYGLNPSNDLREMPALKPVLSFKTMVEMVKTIPAGTQVSYGRTFTAPHELQTATLTVGYADGYCRAFSNKADVLIRGKRCRVLGRVCMDQMVVDVTGLEVLVGDEATLIGCDGDECITAEELANIADTIHYEIVCNISRRVPRAYYKNGALIAVLDDSVCL